MKLSLTIEPDGITPGILRACREVVADQPPTFVTVEPEAGAHVNKCIGNALESTRLNGGEVVMGWKIYLWPRVLVQLIGHAVVRRSDVLRCITPSRTSEDSVLFLADSTITFDESDPSARLGAKMVPLRDDPDVVRFIEVEQAVSRIKAQLPRTSGPVAVAGTGALRLNALQKEQPELIRRITLQTKKPNEVCICDSGRKFRKCCRESMLRAGPY